MPLLVTTIGVTDIVVATLVVASNRLREPHSAVAGRPIGRPSNRWVELLARPAIENDQRPTGFAFRGRERNRERLFAEPCDEGPVGSLLRIQDDEVAGHGRSFNEGERLIQSIPHSWGVAK